MYVPLLILKYLGRRRIAWVSLAGVTLCTAMVLVVISVMGGWLSMFRASFQGLSGDVVVRTQNLAGFPHYGEMIEELEALPAVVAAVPTIDAYGLINIENVIQKGTRVVGVPIDRIGLVNEFPRSLYLKNPVTSPAEPLADLRRQLEQYDVPPDESQAYAVAEQWAEDGGADKLNFELPWPMGYYDLKLTVGGNEGRRGSRRNVDPDSYPGLILGTGVAGLRKDADGRLDRWLPVNPTNPLVAKIVLLALDPAGGRVNLEQQKSEFNGWVVDTSNTGVYTTDANTVYLDFDYLQRQLRMDPAETYPGGFDPDTGQPVGEAVLTPARTSEIHVAAKPGVDLAALRDATEAVVYDVLNRRDDSAGFVRSMAVDTWDQRPGVGEFLNAVERERALVATLFSFISVVAVFLILCIFYMIVQEKTRDVGILKSVGATGTGVAAIFVGYGLAIGLAGGLLGLLVGGLIVRYINEIHGLMGTLLGVEIWSAETYLFDKIPNTFDPFEAAIILAAAVVSSAVGAVVPAIRAASLRPVEALRFE